MFKVVFAGKAGKFMFAGLVALLLFAVPSKSRSLELGLTPSHVYSLWLNINRSLLAYAKIVSDDKSRLVELEAMQPMVFQGKVPADVYALAKKINARLKGHISISTETPDWLIEFEQISASAGFKDEVTTPSGVFLISTQLLNGIVDVVIDNTGWEQPVSDFYVIKDIHEKTPSDVFGLVDLALRRIEIILGTGRG